MSQFTIQQLLNEHLANLMLDMPWVRENQEASDKETVTHLHTHLIPAETQYPFLGDYDLKKEGGIFMINIVEVKGVSWGGAYELADTIKDHFIRNTVLTNSSTDINVVITKSYISSGFTNPKGRYVVPINVKYRSYIQ